MSKQIEFNVAPESLVGLVNEPIESHKKEEDSYVLFLHGAGKATKERSLPIADYLCQKGIGSFAFDFSGHGQSSGTIDQSSLSKRLLEAREAFRVAQLGPHFSLCGFSMGAHVAIQMLRYCTPRALLLFYPAVYGRGVEDIAFGDEAFTLGLRRPKSWDDSSCFDLLESYQGNLMVVIGEHDNVIPEDVIIRIDNAARSASRKIIWRIPGAPHLLIPFLAENSLLFERVCEFARDMIAF